jgi:serine/threonine-protein phosphatase 2A regulatory subunit B
VFVLEMAAAEQAVAVGEGDNWRLSQIIGDPFSSDQVLEGDIITAVEFDEDGDLLAVGDKAGRVSIYKNQDVDHLHNVEEKHGDLSQPPRVLRNRQKIYQFHCHFQSHEVKFDKLKSVEIEERINMMKFCKKRSNANLLLSTNGKERREEKSFLKFFAFQTKSSNCGKLQKRIL